MGIRGLTTFIRDHSRLLTDFDLHDTKVVIDGNNLLHFLYHRFHIDVRFGGDYDAYAIGVKFYFETLKECNVEPYVIFDGAYYPDDRKLETVLKRATEKLSSARSIARGQVEHVLPLLAADTFHSILNELGVQNMTCEFEADSQLTALANELKCPVMSNDSDFYIYDVQGGFIPFDYIKLKKNTKASGIPVNYLKVQIYYLDTLSNNFKGITRDKIPLFASLQGNDYISREDLAPFYSDTKVLKPCTIKLGTPNRFEKISSLLAWLESEETASSATSSVLKCFKAAERDHIQKKLDLAVNDYRCHEVVPMTIEAFVEESAIQLMSGETERIGGETLPKWVLSRFKHGIFPVMFIDVVVSKRVILPAQVEDVACSSSYGCSEKLRQIIYSFLLSHCDTPGLHVTEYGRGDRGDLEKTEVPVLGESEISTTIHTIPSLSSEERLDQLLRCLSISKPVFTGIRDLVGKERVLPYLAVIYWVENADPAVLETYFKTLILCFMTLKLDADVVDAKARPEDGACSASQIEITMEKLRRSCKPQAISVYNSSITHAFAQYQTCLQATLYLNQLLLCPVENVNPARFINGTFFYNLSRNVMIQNQKHPDTYIQEIMGWNEDVLFEYFRQVEYLTECLSSKDKLLSNSGQAGKKKSEKKKDAVAEKLRKEHQSNIAASSDEEADAAGMTDDVQVSCSTDNKFSMLSIG